MELKYTPGPWLYDEGKNIGYWPYVQRGKDGGNTIQSSHSQERANADAQLIAAAPDLYRALELIINSDMAMREEDEGEISTVLSIARAALAKAEGKTQ